MSRLLLLVDDSRADAGLVREALEDVAPGVFEVHHVLGVEEGLAVAAEERLEAVILDIHLPGSEPLEGVRRFREAAPDLPIVVLTGMDDRALAVQALQAGAQDYQVKREMRPEDLLRSLRLAVEAKRARQLERDILERKRAERERERMRRDYELILSSVGEGLFRVDLNGRITFVNPEAARMLGWEEADLVGKPSHESLHHTTAGGDPYPETECPVYATFRDGAVHRVDGEVLWRKDGSSFPAEYVSAPIWEADRVVGAVCTFRDVTDRIRVQQEREELEARLRQSERLEALGQLAGGVAHDFNNLLSVIINYATFVGEAVGDDDRLRQDVAEIGRAAERAAALTHRLLVFSHREVVRPEVVDLNAIVADTEHLLRRTIGENIELRCRRGADPGRVMADPGQIEQVLVNLAVNARDAMPGGGRLVIETDDVELDQGYAAARVDVPPGRYVRLTVADTGTGMTPEIAARAFEPFFTTKPKGRGTGLGLATVYGIVKQSGGHLVLYSEPGRGTVVKVYLPVTGEEQRPRVPSVVPAALQARGETVLLVEDEEAVRAVALRILERNGYRVVEAASPGEALLASARHEGRIHALLTDVVMPEMSGKELAERLVVDRPDLKVIYMSGYTSDVVDHHGALAAPLVEKPFGEQGLLRKLREVCGGSASAGGGGE